MKRNALLLTLMGLAFFMVLVTNSVTLLRVRANRTPPFDAKIRLTERELALPWLAKRENSGFTLRLSWRVASAQDTDRYRGSRSASWLTPAKLESLGFPGLTQTDKQVKRSDLYTLRSYPPRSVFLVLEMDGPAYQHALQQVEEELQQKIKLVDIPSEKSAQQCDNRCLEDARKKLEEEQKTASRLFVVDAELDPHQLRRSYPDRSRYCIVPGQIKVRVSMRKGQPEVYGFVKQLDVERLTLPLEQKKILQDLPEKQVRGNRPAPPRYEAELVYGKKYDPWLEAIQILPPQS